MLNSPMRGKWAQGIVPRNFAWVIRDKLAVAERPGGHGPNHRPVRRMEEIIWLKQEGFTRVVSLLPSPHNLHAYGEHQVAAAHVPFGPHADPVVVLGELYPKLRDWVNGGEKVLLHLEEVGDRVMGVLGGYLIWTGMLPNVMQAINVVEQLLGRQMGSPGRELVAVATRVPGSAVPPVPEREVELGPLPPPERKVRKPAKTKKPRTTAATQARLRSAKKKATAKKAAAKKRAAAAKASGKKAGPKKAATSKKTGTAAKKSPTTKKAAARKPASKTAATSATRKKAGTKKAGTKKAGTKKAGTKKAGTKKAGTKKASVKRPAARRR